MSTLIREIGLEILTSSKENSGTDSKVTVTVLRNDKAIVTWVIEPGNTPKLDLGEYALYPFKFEGAHPVPSTGVQPVSPISGVVEPPRDYLALSGDIAGHLKLKLVIHGSDQWKIDYVKVYVRLLRKTPVPGTIDSFAWMPDADWTVAGVFTNKSKGFKMSNDDSEGKRSLTLVL